MKTTVGNAALAMLVILSFAIFAPVALAAQQGTLGGQFTLANMPPTISSAAVYPAGGGGAVTSMTPGASYVVKVAVSDTNTMNDIDEIRVALVYDAGDADPGGDPGEVGATQTKACLKWVKSTNSWTISPAGGSPASTWSIAAGSCVVPANMAATAGTWEFNFVVGKVATEATGGAGNSGWDLFCSVDDGTNQVQAWPSRDLAVEWYGEITVNTASVSWNNVTPGMDFGEDDASEQTGVSVTYLSNGAYDEQVAASASWAGAPAGSASLNAAGSPGADEFSLKADDAGVLAAAQLVPAVTSSYLTIDDSGVQTDEGGDAATGNTLWLKLGPSFSDAGYSGTIYYRIANGS